MDGGGLSNSWFASPSWDCAEVQTYSSTYEIYKVFGVYMQSVHDSTLLGLFISLCTAEPPSHEAFLVDSSVLQNVALVMFISGMCLAIGVLCSGALVGMLVGAFIGSFHWCWTGTTMGAKGVESESFTNALNVSKPMCGIAGELRVCSQIYRTLASRG
jgi:hypothetical protein